MSGLLRWRALWIILAAYLILGATYSVVNPLFEAPDEIWHYEYVRWIADGHGMAAPEDVGVAPWAQEGSQPPLYYLIGAGLTAPIDTANAAAVIRYNPHAAVGQGDAFGNRNQMVHDDEQAWPWRGVALATHLMRLFSLLLGAVTIACTFVMARRVLSSLPAAAPIAAALVALDPQFLFIHASVTNDALVTAVCAATLLLLTTLLVEDRAQRTWETVALGLMLGAAALSKLSGLLLLVPLLLTVVFAAWRRRSWRELLRGALIPLLLALAVAGWWYWRNQRLFGDPLALNVMFAVLPGRGEPASLQQLWTLAPGVWRSLWGVFGWFNVPADPWLTLLYTSIVAVGLVAAAIDWMRGRQPRAAALLLLLMWIALVSLSLLRWAQISWPQGRLLFPALPALALFVGWGWAAISEWLGARRPLPGALIGGMAIVALCAPFVWIRPAYAPMEPLANRTSIPNALGVRLGESYILEGYSIGDDIAIAGEPLDITLYWRADHPPEHDDSVFLHATDAAGIVQAQRDSYPGLGNTPTSSWQAGALYADRHQLQIPDTILTTQPLTITVGLYDFASGDRLRSESGADEIALGTVTVTPATIPPRVNFGGRMELVQWSLDSERLAPGETLSATLTWEALKPLDRDYVVFAHLVLPPGAVWAQEDDQPQPPTSTWRQGERVSVTHEMHLPPEAPPGDYQVEVGVYDAQTLDRLPVDFSEAGVVIGKVRVE